MNLSARIRPFATIAMMATVFSLALIEPSFAQAGGIESVLQNIVNMLTGNVARLLAIIAVIIVGIAWMFGYLDLRKAAFVVLGIGIIFGATEIVSTLAGGGS
ncbi:MAG TPA: TrbC/VirB2 family protein [Kaistia sp.]|jgi:type IV secretion system protein VirB2|nr:TrbC/VirB2 family protein [Kaistia sp.]